MQIFGKAQATGAYEKAHGKLLPATMVRQVHTSYGFERLFPRDEEDLGFAAPFLDLSAARNIPSCLKSRAPCVVPSRSRPMRDYLSVLLIPRFYPYEMRAL